MKKTLGIAGLLLFSVCYHSAIQAAEIHLEQSFVPLGSSWGTDDAFRDALTLNEDQIPVNYKLPALPGNASFASVAEISLAQGRFIRDKAVLFKSIRFCLDESLPPMDSYFEEAKQVFLDNVAGKESNGRLFELSVIQLSRSVDPVGVCDIVAKRGTWSSFPYKHLPDASLSSSDPRIGKVYGVYYRWDEYSIPVITIHPDIELTYSPPGDQYVTAAGGRLIVDGRALLFHELGHILGFAHIKPTDGIFDFPEATAMGMDNDFRDARAIHLRFEFATNIWKFWDAYQTTVYRRVYQRELNPTCTLPTPDFRPTDGRDLGDVIADFNERLSIEKPWGGYPLSRNDVTSAIQNRIKSLPKDSCSEFRSIFLGMVPENAHLTYIAGTAPCRAPGNNLCRYFMPRLSISKGQHGYSLSVGHDVIEGGSGQ